MQPDATGSAGGAQTPAAGGVRIEDVVGIKEQTLFERMISMQAFWVTVALIIIIVMMSFLQPKAFASAANFYNITRNFAFIGIMAIGMVAVIITGGIDLSVGSIMGLVGVVCGVLLEAQHAWYVALAAGLLTGMAAGAINGVLIAYVGLSPFVVTLGMLSFARSCAIVLSQNKMIYNFGPSGATFKIIGGGHLFGISNPVWVLIVLTALVSVVLKLTTWGRHLYSIGGNEQAARLTGVPVDRVSCKLRHLGADGSDILHSDRRLAGLRHQRARHRLRAPRHRLDRHRRRQPDGRRGRRLWRLHRRGIARGDPQFLVDAGHRFQLARRLCWCLHRSRGSS
jgi:ribose transport system permease protein